MSERTVAPAAPELLALRPLVVTGTELIDGVRAATDGHRGAGMTSGDVVRVETRLVDLGEISVLPDRLRKLRAEVIDQLAESAVAGTSIDKPEELDALAKLAPEKQAEIAERATAGQKVNVKQQVKRSLRAYRELELAERTIVASKTLNDNVYGVILADPPWRFEPYSRETGMDRAADNHYPTEPTDVIKTMRVPAADDCVLYLWATIPMLPEAIEVMRACGFKYKSGHVWGKEGQIGTGYWMRENAEHLLIGTRGSVPAPAPGDQYDALIMAPRGRASKKPEWAYEMIEKLFPNVPKLEMFARSGRDGWTGWGNEAPTNRGRANGRYHVRP